MEHYKDYASDMTDVENTAGKIDHFDRVLEIEGNLTEEQRVRLLEIANKCPGHKTLHQEVEVKTRLE